MKNKILFILLFGVLISLSFFGVAYAQNEDTDFSQEAIVNFHADIFVNADNSIDVVENIVYNTGEIERHGLLRNIVPRSSWGHKMKIENVNAVDENNNPYIFTTSSDSGSNFEIKMGDPDVTFTGERTYIIKYHATKAVAQFKDFDEIYWNVTGNDWNIPIYAASATVFLPSGVTAIQSSCYYGLEGSTEQCSLENEADNLSYNFTAPVPLGAGEGLTVAVSFPKGIVTPYTWAEKYLDTLLPWLIAILLPFLTLIFSLRHWYKKGKDPKGTGVIVSQYDVPGDLTPMEVTGILSEKISASNISAEIIYLATKGFLKIKQTEEKVLGLFNTTDYELTKLKDSGDALNEFDRKLLRGLFSSEVVKLSDLRNVFYSQIKGIADSAADGLLTKGYYKNLGGIKNSAGRLILMIFMTIWASGFFGGILGVLFFNGNPFPLMFGIFLSFIIYGIVSYFYPAKTEKGVATREYILGLKDYLRIAEKDRLLFHNAPEKKPEIFEKLLPYAMVLGVANIWAKEFEGIYTTPPSWYSGSSNTAFSAVMFSNSLSSFSSYASSSMTSSPSGSGSGGGGSSGGGGGGGGGGGW
ncbi:MAG: hypothetical protein UU13_C0014G0008 [Candidatus Nomurabacteria bacterium GW2011_GWB1_40_7]|uniref:DUF2207 domain-containing protein n=1 Tax=Candidatus Nomurabacteria bacterium GW2011_GWB1_40_7 TaxID=1618744 RepID=A0A0G0W488_9BACT|nr:MAG: hypothetical protein UU13_C0014G0008 [Candidatus Nomurabacteria bacterium GW2011_GWB1_40_7]